MAARVGEEPFVERCGPLRLTDLVPALIVAIALLIPDISEVSVPGLAGISFRLDKQEERQSRLEAALVDIKQQTQVAQETNVSGPTILVVDPATARGALEGKEAEFRAELETEATPGDPMEGTDRPPTGEATARDRGPRSESDRESIPTTTPLPEDAGVALLERELLHVWATRLESWAALAERLSSTRLWKGLIKKYLRGELTEGELARYENRLQRLVPEDFDERKADILARWYTVFREEIEIVRGTRNSIAHPEQVGELSAPSLRTTIAIAKRVADLLEAELAG